MPCDIPSTYNNLNCLLNCNAYRPGPCGPCPCKETVVCFSEQFSNSIVDNSADVPNRDGLTIQGSGIYYAGSFAATTTTPTTGYGGGGGTLCCCPSCIIANVEVSTSSASELFHGTFKINLNDCCLGTGQTITLTNAGAVTIRLSYDITVNECKGTRYIHIDNIKLSGNLTS